MSYKHLTSQNLGHFELRLSKLSETTPRIWGSMTAHEMFNHCTQLLEIATGERTLPDFSNLFTRSPLGRWLMIALPWPKGKINPPARMLDDELAPFADERQRLVDTMRRFAVILKSDPHRLVQSPIAGSVTLAFMSKMQGKHLDHHLRQFGV
jgi:hypothetical protein